MHLSLILDFLQDARHAAEAEIYTSLNAKIDQFLQLADYDWMAAVQGGGTPDTSDYLIDLIAFLKSTFSVFTNLPVSTHTLKGKSTTAFLLHIYTALFKADIQSSLHGKFK